MLQILSVCKIIDSHTILYNPNYLPDGIGVREEIDSIKGLKEDIIQHYNEIMRNENEETV